MTSIYGQKIESYQILQMICRALLSVKAKKNLLEIISNEANSVIEFFSSNNLVNNADTARALYNCNENGEVITIENFGSKILKSICSDKLLGLHINFDFQWCTHVEKISIELKKRIGLLRRIRKRNQKEKLIMIALTRYKVIVFLNPVMIRKI